MSDASSDGQSTLPHAGSGGSFAVLFERAPQPMAAVRGTDSPSIQVVNRAFLEQFDGRSVQVDGGRYPRRTELSGIEREVVRTAAEGAAATDAVTKRTADGRRAFAVRAIPADQTDVTAFLQYRDVTARRIRDQQLAVLQRVLRHDLRNDLTVLLGYAQTIAETSDDPAAREAAETMVESASDLRSVAESAGRMQCVTAAPKPSPLDDAVARVRRALVDDVSRGISIDGCVPSTVVDSRIGIALEELCRTMVDHGGATTIELSASTDERWTTLTVEADASIPEQERAALVGRDETKLRHATGIGPWIARWAVRAPGGHLRVDRCGDDGARVTLSAPTLDATPRRDADAAAWMEY